MSNKRINSAILFDSKGIKVSFQHFIIRLETENRVSSLVFCIFYIFPFKKASGWITWSLTGSRFESSVSVSIIPRCMEKYPNLLLRLSMDSSKLSCFCRFAVSANRDNCCVVCTIKLQALTPRLRTGFSGLCI